MTLSISPIASETKGHELKAKQWIKKGVQYLWNAAIAFVCMVVVFAVMDLMWDGFIRAILFSGTAATSEKQCASNVKRLSLAMALYA